MRAIWTTSLAVFVITIVALHQTQPARAADAAELKKQSATLEKQVKDAQAFQQKFQKQLEAALKKADELAKMIATLKTEATKAKAVLTGAEMKLAEHQASLKKRIDDEKKAETLQTEAAEAFMRQKQASSR